MGLAAWENHDSDDDEADLLIPEAVYYEQMASDPTLYGITHNPEDENDEFAFDYDDRVTNEDEADLLIPEAVYYEQMASDPILYGITNNPEDEIDEYAYSEAVYNDQIASYDRPGDMVGVNDDEDDDDPNKHDAHLIGML